MFTLIERFQAKKYRPGVRRVGELERIQARKRDRIIHTFSIHPDFAHFADHRIGARQRRAFRHFHAADQVQLILGRNKPAGNGFKHHARGTKQQQINRKHGPASAKRFAHQPLIAGRAAVEKAVERTENPAEQTIDKPGREIFRGAVWLQQQRSQRRRERQRVDGGDHRGNRYRHRKLLVELTGHTGEERHRHEHRAQHQRNGDNRPGHFTHRLMRRRKRGKPLFDISFDVFHHHDGIVHHDTNRQHQPEQAQSIQRKAEQIENTERAHHRYRHRDQRNDRRAPGLQEQDHHQHNQHHRFQQRLHHRADRITHKHRRVVRRRPFHIVRESCGQFVHFGAHRVRQIDGVCPRRLEDTNPDRVLVVELRTQRIAAGTHLNTRHVAQADDRTILRCFQDNIAELIFGMQTALGVYGDQEIALFRQRLGAKLPGGHLHVLLLHRCHHVGGRQPARRHLVRVQPDAHRIFARAKNLYLPHAGQTRQLVLHLQRGVVTHVQ